jgi:hypothetical protein
MTDKLMAAVEEGWRLLKLWKFSTYQRDVISKLLCDIELQPIEK